MNWSRAIVGSILTLSLAANLLLGVTVYQHSKILQMQSDSYDQFKALLASAVKDTDAAAQDSMASSAQVNNVTQANRTLERAMGMIMGLRVDFAKRGMDIYPIFVALIQSENPDPRDPDFAGKKAQDMIRRDDKTLHELYSVLSGTSYTKAGLGELKKAVMSLDQEYPGYPSYSSLR